MRQIIYRRPLRYSRCGGRRYRSVSIRVCPCVSVCGTLLFAASAGAGAFAAAPDNPYEFLCGIRGFSAWLDFAKPRPVFQPRRFAPLTGAGASAFPRTPLPRAARKEFRGYHQPLNLRAPAFRRLTAASLAAPMLALRSLNPREHLGGFRAAFEPRRGIFRCRFTATACGTKSLPCGLRAHYSAKSPSAAFEPPRPSGFSRFCGSLARKS